MRLVEFIIALLEAHGETLKRLAALFGEENLLELLEMAGDISGDATGKEKPQLPQINPDALAELEELSAQYQSSAYAGGNTYAEIEGSVRELGLPATLEFHLWTYPLYRAFIESSLDLNTKIPGPDGPRPGLTGGILVDNAVAEAEAWVRALPMSDLVRDQASRAAQVPWLRFRTTALKRIGRRPLGPVY